MNNDQVKESVSVTKSKHKILDGLFSNLKRIKHLDIIISILFIAIILLVYFSTFSSTNKGANLKLQDKVLIETTKFEEYVAKLEDKIEETLSSIKGAGNISVLLTFDRGIETVIAYTTKTETTPNGTTETKSPVLLTNSGKSEVVVLEEIMPLPSSVVIVATGASNTNVKLELLRAVQSMFKLQTSNIEIFAGN